MDGHEDLLSHCPKPNQPYAAGIDRLKGLYMYDIHCSSARETGSLPRFGKI